MESIKLFQITLERRERHNNQTTHLTSETYPILYLDEQTATEVMLSLRALISLTDVYPQLHVEGKEFQLTPTQLETLHQQQFIGIKSLSPKRCS